MNAVQALCVYTFQQIKTFICILSSSSASQQKKTPWRKIHKTFFFSCIFHISKLSEKTGKSSWLVHGKERKQPKAESYESFSPLKRKLSMRIKGSLSVTTSSFVVFLTSFFHDVLEKYFSVPHEVFIMNKETKQDEKALNFRRYFFQLRVWVFSAFHASKTIKRIWHNKFALTKTSKLKAVIKGFQAFFASLHFSWKRAPFVWRWKLWQWTLFIRLQTWQCVCSHIHRLPYFLPTYFCSSSCHFE